MSPGGRTVIVYRENEAFSIVDLFLAMELAVGSPPISSESETQG